MKELLSVPAVATYAGTAASIWAISENYLLIGTIVLSCLCVTLLISNYLLYQRYRRFKQFKCIDRELRRLSRRTQDFILNLRISANKSEFDKAAAVAIRNALDVASNIFSTLTQVPCTASLMLYANGTLSTNLYCYSVDPARETAPSRGLDPTKGVAGQALGSGEAVVWTDGDATFRELRKDHPRFYRSGITAPFKVGDQNAGLLNIDCLKENGFDEKMHSEIAMTIADTIGMINEVLQLRQE